MGMYKNLYMQYMDIEGIKYTNQDGERVRVSYSGDNKDSIPVYVIFDKDGEGLVTMYCWSIAKFPEEKKPLAYKICNDLNDQYRWVKFYLDKDSEIAAQLDAYIYPDSCGEECANLVRRIVNIVDDTYPTFMKALWS